LLTAPAAPAPVRDQVALNSTVVVVAPCERVWLLSISAM